MFSKITSSIPTLGEIVELRAKRHEAISSNITNADTPGYKAVDFNFASAMHKATGVSMRFANEPGSEPSSLPPLDLPETNLLRTNARHLGFDKLSSADRAIDKQFRTPNAASLDGNSVDLDLERAQFTENLVKYEAALRSINGHLSTMKKAMDAQGR